MASISLTGCQSVPNEGAMSSSERELAHLMKVRLAYAPKIAWIKYPSGQPIADNAREVVLLKNLEESGQKLGLNPKRVHEFFAGQMEAFQTVQKEEIAAWRAGSPSPKGAVMDLKTEIRPAIEKLNGEILTVLAKPDVGHSSTVAGYCRDVLHGAGFSEAASQQASAPIVSDTPWKTP